MIAPVLIMAGGTGGHIFPGLAVAQALRERGVPVQWLGAAGAMETRLVPEAGIELHTLRIGGLRGKSVGTLLRAPFKLLAALFAALRLFGRIRPRAVISFGGFAAGPGGVAAVLRRVPLLVHEQNRVAGFTNRRLAPWSRRVLAGFPDALPKAEWVGNPVRADIASLPPPAQRMAAREGAPRLLVLGGSLGAAALNSAVPAALALLPPLASAAVVLALWAYLTGALHLDGLNAAGRGHVDLGDHATAARHDAPRHHGVRAEHAGQQRVHVLTGVGCLVGHEGRVADGRHVEPRYLVQGVLQCGGEA